MEINCTEFRTDHICQQRSYLENFYVSGLVNYSIDNYCHILSFLFYIRLVFRIFIFHLYSTSILQTFRGYVKLLKLTVDLCVLTRTQVPTFWNLPGERKPIRTSRHFRSSFPFPFLHLMY